MSLIKSKQRVADHGEVFTPDWMVKAMLDLVKEQTDSITARFLEPACGSGNFLVEILRRKLNEVEKQYGKSDWEKRHYALVAVMSLYGIELQEDNIKDCRDNVLNVLKECYNLAKSDDLYRAAFYVLSQNLVHGDALEKPSPIVFTEWELIEKSDQFSRKDWRMDDLTKRSTLEPSLFEIDPIKTHPPITLQELADLAPEEIR